MFTQNLLKLLKWIHRYSYRTQMNLKVQFFICQIKFYWKDLFTKTKRNKKANRYPKGFLEVQFKFIVMTEGELYKLIDLIKEINRIEVMLKLHSKNKESKVMLNQYNAKKLKLTKEIISELLATSDRSYLSMGVIKSIFDKFYKNHEFFRDNNKQNLDYKKLIDAI